MATLDTCISNLLADGALTREQADQVKDTVNRQRDALMRVDGLSPEAAEREASRVGVQMARQAVELIRYQKALQVIALDRAMQNVTTHPEGVLTGINSLLGRDLTRNATYTNVDRRGRAVLHELHRRFAEPMEALRTKNLGLTQDRTTMRNMVRELLGQDTGDHAAKTFARAWSETAEYARTRFNRAGGAIAKREDWGLPQFHDARKVGRTDKAEWKTTINGLIDRNKMLNDAGQPMNDLELDALLNSAYDRIVTNGLVDLTPGRVGGSKLANRRQDSRVLVFKDGDAWLEYGDKFGRPDLFLTLSEHLDGMSHDIGLLEVLGPNPELTYRTLRDMAKKEGEGGIRLATLDSLYNVVSGKVDDTATLWAADTSAAFRNWITAARLGSAMLSAVSDIQFLRQTSRWTGMSPMRVMARQMSLLNPKNAEDRLLAVQMGLGAEAWVTRALAANRFSEVTGAGISAKMADFTMRASGLSAWTDAGKKAFAMELYGLFGRNRRVAFDELAPDFRRELERYGFDSASWDDIRKTQTLNEKGAHFFSTENLFARTDLPEARKIDLNNKVQEMQAELSIFAVPEPDARAKALTTAGTARGTLSGETMRFVSQFKSFPVSVILSHFYRGMYEHGTGRKLSYMAQMIVGTTALGLLALQAKELSKGRDPRPVDAKTVGAAFLQGGGAGIYGDFLYTGLFGANRFGSNALTTLSGPAAGLFFSDIPRVTTGQFGEVIEGRDPKVASDLIRLAKSYTPGGSLWYLRLALEREVFDQLELMADPAKARRRQSATVRRRQNEFDQGYWWRPGRTSPDRAPNLGGQ